MSYKIIRHYHPSQNKPDEMIDEGLTLEEAQDHCGSEDSCQEDVYFDGYADADPSPSAVQKRKERDAQWLTLFQKIQ